MEFGQVEQWMSFMQTSAFKSIAPACYAVFGHRIMPQKEFNEHVKKVKSVCKTFDGHLKDRSYLVGDSLTLADVICAVLFTPAF